MSSSNSVQPGQVRAVFLDAANTLLRATPPVSQRYAATAAAFGVTVDARSITAAFRALWPTQREKRSRLLHQASEEATFGFWFDVITQIFAPWHEQFTDFEAFARKLYLDFADPSAWALFDDVRPCIDALRDRGLTLALVSNWDMHLRPILQGLDLARCFDHLSISAELGVEKPNPAIFNDALQALALEPGQVLHIGDTYSEDIVGARAAGLWAVHLKRSSSSLGGPVPQFTDGVATLCSLAQVEVLLDRRQN
ncbi:MAG: HAD-IA family hydrolase [Pseudomonadota bacterium]